MRVLQLPAGETAPEDQNRIIVTETTNGRFDVTAVAANIPAIYIAPVPFPSEQEALNAAVDWAQQYNPELILLERRTR